MKTYVCTLMLVSAIVLPQRAHAERPQRPVPPPVPTRFRCRLGSRRISRHTPSGRKAMSASPSGPCSAGRRMGRRPRCSMRTASRY